ncbi:MAG: chitobiase/beta-hexosaminidase C-terminal domain-containing protein, partial [Bacteroidales bacterium]|nr:chitobiase/beta-hexosaminidase C-terminal domain-containing protein [Bacteroidales bacterium]
LKSATSGDFLTGVIQVAAGYRFSLALDGGGTVWAWGDNALNKLGDGTLVDKHYAIQVQADTGTALANIRKIAASHDFGLALDGDNKVWAWGANDAGKLGIGNTSTAIRATKVKASGSGTTGTDFTDVEDISTGGTHAVFLKTDGTVWCSGQQSNGRLGNGLTAAASKTNPVQAVTDAALLTPLSGIIQVAAGPGHTLALKSDGTVWAWGDNADKQLGDGLTTDWSVAKQVTGLPANVVYVGTGGDEAVPGVPSSSYAITEDGRLFAWGYNGFGQLATGNTTAQGTPVEVSPGYSFSNVAPQASLTTEGLIFSPPATVTLSAATTDPEDGEAAVVDFFQDGLLVGSDAGSPFTLTLNGLAAGNYSFQAVAYDTEGAWGDSNIVNISVAQPVVSVQALIGSVKENAPDNGVFRILRSAQSSILENLSVNYTVSGTATAGTDYATLSGSAVIPQGFNSVDVAVDPIADWVTEGDETVQVTLSPSASYGVDGSPATVTIEDVPVATPVLNPWTTIPGYTDRTVGFQVTVTCETPGAVLRYTTDGSEPTTASTEIASGGQVSIETNLTLKVKAWDGEGQASATAVGNYRATGIVAAGGSQALAVKSNGKATAWGNQASGQLGNGQTATADKIIPVDVLKTPSPGTAFHDAAFAAGGENHTLVIDKGKNLWAFGLNTNGQLGVNSITT